MKQFLLAISLILALQALKAQSIHRSIIGSAGQVTAAGGYKLSYTLGETIIKKLSASGLTINQGFQQNKLSSTPLPITGLAFDAKRINDNEVALTWETITELNNKGFQIERQLKTENEFSPIEFEWSKAVDGVSPGPLFYNVIDRNDFGQTTLYRLKQEDFDGKYTYSQIRVVKGNQLKNVSISIWPVPSTDEVNLKVNGISNTDILYVFDSSGQQIRKLAVQDQAIYPISDLESGSYFVVLESDKTITQKLIIQK